MPDPIDELENFDPGAPMSPLPPSEVRRLGDRHRHRRTAGVALAAAAAVVVVATGTAVLTGGETRSVDPAPPNPTVTTPSGPSIPDSLDITVGMSEAGSAGPVLTEGGGATLAHSDLCDGRTLRVGKPLDSRVAAVHDRQHAETREVVLYRDEAQAARALAEVSDSARSCRRSSTLTEVSTWGAGEDGVIVVRTFEDTPGAEILHFARIGDALLATSWYSGSEISDTAPRVAQQSDSLEVVVDQMCVFTDAGCSTVTESPDAAPTSDDIPAGFPLAAGWPDRHEPGERGLTGPAPDVAVLDGLEVCDAALPEPAPLDRLGASWGNVEDYRNRLLLTFEDADGAIAYQGQLLDTYRACPRTEDAEGNATVTDVRQTRVGGESWAFVRTYEYQGAPAIGMEVVHVIRLGRSLLVDTAANEGGGGPDPEADVTAQIARQTADSAEVVSAMCAFTEAGC